MASAYLDQALIAYAKASSTVTAVIGDRLYHIVAPKNAPKPYSVLSIPAPSNDSMEFGKARQGQPIVQIMSVSDANKVPADAFIVSHAYLDLFANFQGLMDGILMKYIGVRGPKELPLTNEEEIACIVELMPMYTEV